ncbi:monooxygenase [Actinoplanes italicus]|uniref:2-polyprenyl-6-methoxyphenol hydroxylase-like FAD-dependent oxidoreductase n=1 Tax=Actinoplanes italicus TaxID=113567 RepID=A0A2T0K914_9ACTN|nr:NAD(P)/FAD-dependent oxidoreductase [Actinoplanes italicus]PRX19276.1 2-polyprenyl-6-methoxyphenol hydroxylase-like FAD-dependent oxidoreductase [Actinoplanes italicus]GIE30709.1 monooxygenase [Actinoplanes italicus]
MTVNALRVGIVGAGIGGLTLAHALQRRGIGVTVFERDSGPQATAGYRLHLPATAFTALAEVLPAASVRALRECGAGNDSFRQFAVLDHRGRVRLRIPIEHAGEALLIGRRPLRAVLARGLGDVIRWNTTVSGWTASPDGVELADGSRFDLLVAADGTGSRAARRLLGRSTARRSGFIGIAGRSPLPQRIPADLRRGLAFMVGPGGVGAFLSLHGEHGRDPAAEHPYVVWSVSARLDDPDADLAGQAHRLTARWSDDFHTLIDRSEPGSVAAFPFHFPAALGPWASGPVTLLGDAVHPMPPTAGAGAGTAILDAAYLAEDLGTRPVREALAAYRTRLLTYAPAAVDEARPALLWQRRLENPMLYALAVRLALPAVDAGLRLVRRGRPW